MKIEELIKSPNIAENLSEDLLSGIGLKCKQGFDDDKTSRAPWEEWYAQAMKLALQVKEARTFPWPNASNVKFPLLTIAAMNWHAKAYPALINGESVVKMRTLGLDPTGAKFKSAGKVSKDLSYQLLENSNWEEQTDKSLLVEPIMGTIFKKTVRDNNLKQNCSDLVMPQDLVVNYYTTDINTASRVSHILPATTKNEMQEYILQGLYRKTESDSASAPGPDALKDAQDKSQHLIPPPNWESPLFYPVEQCCWFDLDKDGYEEPYTVTFERTTGYIYRIIARYYKTSISYISTGQKNAGKIYRIEPENYYTKYEFIPSPDGGFYGLGLGLLLGPLNESVNSAINQIFDAGTMKTLGGGFLGRGARIKGGDTTFKPFEWKTVDSSGDDLRKNIVPLQIAEISPILLDLVKFLVNYGERVGGSGDIQMGELPGQNVKAETMSIANENGRLIFNATYKRNWRSMKEEFKKFYKLRQIYLDADLKEDSNFFGITKEDYNFPSNGIIPSADPNITSNTEKRLVADLAYQMAHNDPGFNSYLVNKMRLDAYGVPLIDTIYPDPNGPNAIQPGPNIQMLELQIKAKKVENEKLAIDNKNQEAIGKLLIAAQETQALIDKYEAEAAKALAEADGVKTGHAIGLLDSLIGAQKSHKEHLMRMADFLKESMNDEGTVSRVAPAATNAGILPLLSQSQGVDQDGLGTPSL